jgi:hypothetical protein
VSSPIWGSWSDVYYCLTVTALFLWGVLLKRGRVCLLCMLLALASADFLGSESFGTGDHILLSQIWDFPFRLLLRLAGSRWSQSTPPPHRLLNQVKIKVKVRQLLLVSRYITSGQITQKTHPLPRNGYSLLLRIRCRGMCLLSRFLAMGLCVTILFDVLKDKWLYQFYPKNGKHF